MTGFRVYIGIEKYTYDTKKGTSQKTVVDGNLLETVAEERVIGSAIHGDWTLWDHCATLQEADSMVAAMVHIKPPFTGYPCACLGQGGLHVVTGDAMKPRTSDRGVTHRAPGYRKRKPKGDK